MSYRKAAFANMRELIPFLERNSFTDDDLWELLKHQRGGVESRKEWTEEDWAVVHARLHGAALFQ